jgi:coenzyme Q-binding protein COQ10
MYALVRDVERYPEFLPWCLGCRVVEESADYLLADMVVGYKIFREKFRSRVRFVPPAFAGAGSSEIHVEYLDGPLRHLKNDWIFSDAGDKQCAIDFHIDFEFHSRMLQAVAETFFNRALGRMMDAFEERAAVLYGQRQ